MRGVASPRDRIERLLFVAMLSLSAAGTADLRLRSTDALNPPFGATTRSVLAETDSAEACTESEPTCYITVGGVRPFRNAMQPSPTGL